MDIREIQGYTSFFMSVILVILLYGYIFHLYRSEKKGERDYEKYGKIALDDNIDSTPIEDEVSSKREHKKKEENK